MSKPFVLSAHDLTFGYASTPLCQPLDFTLAPGEWCALMGPNGIGKTALLRTLCGLSDAHDGHIRVDGEALTSAQLREGDYAVYIGHLSGLKPELTVYENLSLYASLYGVEEGAVLQSAEEIGIAPLLHQLCAHLSQGQLRRAALCRLALSRSLIWLLDEPVASLDRNSITCFCSWVERHLQKGGCALIATHHPLDIQPLIQHNTLQLQAHA